jgi:putative transposase
VRWKKLYRLRREERLTERKHGGSKRGLGEQAPIAISQDANQWPATR